MSSKRRKRRQAERKERELRGGIGNTIMNPIPDGTVGKSMSFADRILSRVHTLGGKQDSKQPEQKQEGGAATKVAPAPSSNGPSTATAGPQKMEMPAPRIQPAPSLAPPPQTVPAEAGDTVALINQSHQMKQRIWKMAQENQDYYLLKQMEDKDPKPWFMYPKQDIQYSEFVMLTPAMAKTMLEYLWSKDEGNRNKKPALVEAYKRDIVNDRWIPTDEAIGINLSFEVYNGQHRLWAVYESGKPMPFYITWNVLDEAKFFVESGAKRTLAERLKMVTEPRLGNRTSGFCKAIMRGLGTRTKWTDSDIADFAAKWDDLLVWVSEHLPTARAEVQAAVAKAYLWYGGEKIEPFCYRLRNIKFPDDGDPAKALYTALQNAKKNRMQVPLVAYKKTLQALDALFEGRPLNKVYEKEEDIFVWQPGWELPPKPAKATSK